MSLPVHHKELSIAGTAAFLRSRAGAAVGNSAVPGASRLLHDHLHRIEVVPLHLEIRHPAIPLGRLYIAVPEKILDGAQIGIRIEQLRSHRVPEMVTGKTELCLTGIILR